MNVPLFNKKVTNEPFSNAKDVEQVYYINNNINANWLLVVHVGSRAKFVVWKRQLRNTEVDEEKSKAFESLGGESLRDSGCILPIVVAAIRTVQLQLQMDNLMGSKDEGSSGAVAGPAIAVSYRKMPH